MRYLWIVTIVMVVAGVIAIVAGLLGLLEPVAIILGVLLLWSGAVKIIVLRIWRASLKAAPVPPDGIRSTPMRVPLGRQR